MSSSYAPPVVLKEGFLSKRSRAVKLMPRFQRRYFRLFHGELQYFHTPQETVPRRRIPLRLDSKVMPTNDQGFSCCFTVKATPTAETFYVQGEQDHEVEEWVNAIYDALRRTEDVADATPSPPLTTPSERQPQPQQPPERVLLHLNIVAARKLKGVDLNGKSDPFCVVKLVGKDGQLIRSEEMKTNYVTDTLDPEWNQHFTLGKAVNLSTVEAIHFELWDHDHLMKNELIGFVRVPLSIFQMSPASTAQSELVDRWFRVEPPGKTTGIVDSVMGSSSPRKDKTEQQVMLKNHGELRLVMSVAGPNLVKFFQSMHLSLAPQSRIVIDGIDHTDNRLEVTVLGAKDLIAADFNKSSDPFVELTLLDDKGKPIRGEFYRTSVKEKTRNPSWEDEHYTFGRICRIDEAAKLRVRVMDWDEHSKNDPLGGLVIDLDHLSAHRQTDWFALQPEQGMAIRENLGSIQMSIALSGETRGERKRRLQIDKEIASKSHERSVEQLELENATYALHEAACKLDGARIACAVDDYQLQNPQFYGINGCIHHLNTQLPRAHRDTTSTDEGFQARAGIEGQAILDVSVVGTYDLKKAAMATSWAPFAVIEIDPPVCVEECKRVSAPLSPQKSKRIQAMNTAAAESRGGMFSKRAQGEVSAHRTKLGKNEVRSEKRLDLSPDQPMLKVEIKSGHGLTGVDFSGYSDPYCTLSLTDRETKKSVEAEKKRTAVIPKTLNPVWQNEVFFLGHHFPLSSAATLLIHVKDHNLTRSTPLGRVEIPISDLCHASAKSTSISTTAQEKRYPLMPEPWVKKHAQNLGELCIRTEVIGDATVLAEMLQRSAGEESPGKMLSFLSMQSFSSDQHLSEAGVSSLSLNSNLLDEDETTQIIEKGQQIRTATAAGVSATWRKEKFSLVLSYPGIFGANRADREQYTLRLRVFGARDLLGSNTSTHMTATGAGNKSQRQHLLGRRAETNAYFTVIPVLKNGQLEHAERKQSLTVYGSRNPNWPDQEFVFGKSRKLDQMTYLSLHVYARDLDSEVKHQSLSGLLQADEQMQIVRLKRYHLRKIGATGVVDDDGLEILAFDQRVLAYRKCDQGGRFFPARVRKYRPLPHDDFEVMFEDGIESIDDLWDLFSLDVKGKIESIHANGTVDVSLGTDKGVHDGVKYARNVPLSLLTPVDNFTPLIESVMARRMNEAAEKERQWQSLKHSVAGLIVEVMSVTGLPKHVVAPKCVIKFLGNPHAAPAQELCSIGHDGLLVSKKPMLPLCSTDKTVLAFSVAYDGDAEDVHDQKRFKAGVLDLGVPGDADGSEVVVPFEENAKAMEGKNVLTQTASLLIEIIDETTKTSNVIAHARVNLAALHAGKHDLSVKLLPPENVEYYKYVGTLVLHVKCTESATMKLKSPIQSSVIGTRKVNTVCGAMKWFEDRAKIESPSAAPLLKISSPRQLQSSLPKPTSRIARRQLLRSSLTPTENAQVDAFHTVLVIIMKRVVSIWKEIQLLEAFENLSVEDMPKFRHVHSVNADMNSEWIGRPINELGLETRKSITVELEMELLDIAASNWKRETPPSGLSREEWVQMRSTRQRELQRVGGFFMQDRTSAVVLSLPCCFTGEGMVEWICRAPSVLWKDGWVKYCHDPRTRDSCKLHWTDSRIDPDAMEAPRDTTKVLMWLSTLSDAGYIENVSPSLTVLDANKLYYLVESKPDRYYRLREVERWVRNEKRGRSLFPLDLVPEIDCYQQVDVVPIVQAQAPAARPSSPKKDAVVPPPAPIVEVSKDEVLTAQKRTYAKKLVDHVEGPLGLQNSLSSLLLSHEVQKSSLLKPVAAKTQELVDEKVLWDWKYSLFIPTNKSIYVYEADYSTAPTIILDMSSTVCHAAYNFAYDKSGGWFNIVNATVLQASLASDTAKKYTPIHDDLRDKLMKVNADGSLAFEFKTPNAQLWVQSFIRAGVRVDMKPGQLVVLKQLNAVVLQQKCINRVANFNPKDLEGSFQRLLNRFFRHDEELSHLDHEKKMRDLRAKLRSEMKKPGDVGDAVMSYYGKGQRLNPGPTNERLFTRGALYSGRIVRIRSPFADGKYRFSQTYTNEEAPPAMKLLLSNYRVTSKESWLQLPKWKRDIFLLYDIEYRHAHEIIIEEGMLREHIRTNDGDLDATKVQERCTDLNLWFKPSDLEDCVTRMVIHTAGRKPLGSVKIPVKSVTPHRTMDVWYPLAPENEMVQKAKLGQIRVQLRLVNVANVERSKKVASMLLDDVKEAAAIEAASKPLAKAITAVSNNPLAALKDKLSKSAKRPPLSPTTAGAFVVSRERSFVTIRILEGRKMIAADFLTSDPFVKIILVREKDGKEENTKLKTDIKYKTLSPKWQNQEFVLGKSRDTMLSDKKAVILRVMDHDLGRTDDPMGYLKLEFQRDKSGYINGLVLVHADEKGATTSRALHLNDQQRVDVDEKILADEKAGQSASASARGNNFAVDGKLGKLRFVVEIQHNENFVDPAGVSAAQVTSIMRSLETKFSLEVCFRSIALHGKAASSAATPDWKQFSCVFIPKGEGGQRMYYDVHTEDLGSNNTLKLNELISDESSSARAQPKILGRTYDMSRVAYFDVELRHITTGKSYTGRFGERLNLKDPRKYEVLQNELLILNDKEDKELGLQLTFDVRVSAIHRAQRLKRLLAETFRIVGLDFDVRRINDDMSAQGDSRGPVYRFLWEVCKVHTIPGRNTTQALLAQMHRMCYSTRLHWKYTPQLLGLLLEHVFSFGDKDRLSYDDAVALDSIMTRWSTVLQHLNEAKTQLVGHLHGKETPRLIHVLMSECDWTGFELASLPTTGNNTVQDAHGDSSARESLLQVGSIVHALLPARKHAGLAVDVRLASGHYVAGTIIADHSVDHCFDVAFCTSAKLRDEDDGYFSDDEELPPLVVGQKVFVCPIAMAETSTAPVDLGLHSKPRIGRVEKIDEVAHSKEPYHIIFEDLNEPKELQAPRVWLDSMFPRVPGEDISLQLAKEDFVRVLYAPGVEGNTAGSRHAKIVKNHRNGKYDVEFLDAMAADTPVSSPIDATSVGMAQANDQCVETHVPRARLEVVNDRVLYDGEILHKYIAPVSAPGNRSSYEVLYDLKLKNGDIVEGVSRESLRQHEEHFPSDNCLLASVFLSTIEVQDQGESKTNVSKRLSELFANDQIVKVYVMLPSQPTQIHLRDGTTNKLLQSKLKTRDPNNPRFVEQCHGYSTTFSKAEEAKMKQIFETSAVIRDDAVILNDPDAFDASRSFVLYLAPQPRVEIHGTLRITPESTPSSWNLFRMLASFGANDKRGLSSLLQSLVRSAASEHMPLNRKERIVVVKNVSLVDGQQLNVVFEIGVPHNNRGSLEHAISVAQNDAAHIMTKLLGFKWLCAYGEETTAESLEWLLQSDKIGESEPALRVQLLDSQGKEHSEPSLTLELLPLDDQRLSVVDAKGKRYEICLPMDRILVEAQLRRHLVPHLEAEVVGFVKADADEDIPEQQVNRRKRRDSVLLSKPTEMIKIKKSASVGREVQVRFKNEKAAVKIPEHDLKFDTLQVLVTNASELKLSDKMGAGNFKVELMLKSSDFEEHDEGEIASSTPFGLRLSEHGEIIKDFVNNQYPRSSEQLLVRERTSAEWRQPEGARPTVFGQPGIDLERVSGVTVKVISRDTNILIGATFIPLSSIPMNLGVSSDDATDSVDQKKSNVLARFLPQLKSKSDALSRQLSQQQTFGLYRTENDEKVPVGKITLQLQRNTCAQKDDAVLAKRLVLEEDSWNISAYELLALTLKQHKDQLLRGLLATSTIVPDGGLRLLTHPVEQELQLQKIANVMLISHAMEKIYATKTQNGAPSTALAFKDGSAPLSSPRMLDQMRQIVSQTKWLIEDTAAEFGIRTTGKRLPWSANALGDGDDNSRKADGLVVVRANVSNSAMRVRRTMLKLYQMYRHRLIPTLQRLYELDKQGDRIDIKAGEQLLRFFEDEVEDLDENDQQVYRRVYQRIRVIKIVQVLQDIMHTTLYVIVMNHDQSMGDDEIGTATIPLIDLLDRVEHDNYYELTKKTKRFGRSGRPDSPSNVSQVISTPQGKVRLRIQFSYSDSSLLEQATTVYKLLKDKFIAQHEVARRRINAAVVPAQRRRWMTIKGYLDELKAQATSKLHWERTPVLLNLVWDIFVAPDTTNKDAQDEEEEKRIQALAEQAAEYRSVVVEVHKRWANLQPRLEELLQIQAATQIHAQRTPELLGIIEKEVEGLDLVLSTAWQQVKAKWDELEAALNELVRMKERNKLHLSRAPQLLKKVTTWCSKGLNETHADAVSTVQFRWMAITQKDGPLNELRLTEKKGMHWRRTHELVLLLNEQCEGFADVDAKTLDIVQKRWQQLQEWLDDVVQMQIQHTIDCEATPFILKKMHLLESRHKVAGSMKTSSHVATLKKRVVSPPSSPKMARSPSTRRSLESTPSTRDLPAPLPGGQSFSSLVDVEVDVDRLEGLAEWYAIEETKRELERIPFHRITTDFDRNNRLRYSQDGKDTRLLITQEEIVLTPHNVRAALVDRGVIPVMASFVDSSEVAHPEITRSLSGDAAGLPKDLLEEIRLLEQSIESMQTEGSETSAASLYVKWNPERVAELYLVIESLGKSDLLWKIDHVVNTNRELEVPNDYRRLLFEMKLRQISTTEIEELVTTLLVTLQKEELAKMGVEVPASANFTAVLGLMHRHQVKDVRLPFETTEVQRLLQERGLDKRGEPVYLRGMRIGTQMWNPDDASHNTSSVTTKAAMMKINSGLGIVDGKVEQLRKSLLMEALRKRNSLIKSFPGDSYILTAEELAECTEVDMSGDYRTLIERFQQLLIHESYTKRLAEYAAMDRCMRGLLRVPANEIVTKEDIAKSLQPLGSRYRLPLEAFTRDELLAAASQGKIRTPTEAMLARCPVGNNAKSMAFYAAMSHAALVFQETVRFRARLDPISQRFVDAFPFEVKSSVDGMSVPKNRSKMNFKEYVVDWLLGTEESVVKIQRRLGAYHRQRLEWASAAFTLRNRWYHRGFGWCDDSTKCAGVKVLLQKLLLFENANKMHMIDTEALLSEVNDKCVNLRAREKQAKELLEQRYADNFQKLETLVIFAEKCMNNRKLHTEDTPALLHAIEQACVVPYGLNRLHQQAYHEVSTAWARHRAQLTELVGMQKQGVFSIERTPELLNAMEFHTEGIAGADELNLEKVMAVAGTSTAPIDLQQRYVDQKVDEIRRGQRKQVSTLRLSLEGANSDKDVVLEELKETESEGQSNQWQSLSPSSRVVQPLSPRDKQTAWKVVTGSSNPSSPSTIKQSIQLGKKTNLPEQRRKSSIGEDIKELLRSPSKWLMSTTEPQDTIRPEIFFPRELCINYSHVASQAPSSASAAASAAPASTPAEG